LYHSLKNAKVYGANELANAAVNAAANAFANNWVAATGTKSA
jgi:hypothetical protein